jgi:hypothetical protein
MILVPPANQKATQNQNRINKEIMKDSVHTGHLPKQGATCMDPKKKRSIHRPERVIMAFAVGGRPPWRITGNVRRQ